MYLRWSLKSSPCLFKRFVRNSLYHGRMLVTKGKSCDSFPRLVLLSRVCNSGHKLCLPEHRRLHTHKRVGPITPLYLQAYRFADRLALIDENGVYRYGDLMTSAELLTDRIADHLGGSNDDTGGERVCILCPNNASHVVAQLAAWLSGSVAVPVSHTHPATQLEYFLADSQCRMVITTDDELADRVQPVASKLGVTLLLLSKTDFSGTDGKEQFDDKAAAADEKLSKQKDRHSKRLNRLQQLCDGNRLKNKPALIFYTSGTTGSPKGVVHTYGSLQAQIVGMEDRWAWSSSDVLLHVLPLHHVHGNVNCLMTPMWCGACCVMMPRFDAAQIWSKLLSPVSEFLPRTVNLFMAVPTIYAKLIENYDERMSRGPDSNHTKDYIKITCSSKIRLFVSGSAALPAPIMQRWQEITGHTLLERYGMTEMGMALTNPLNGPRIAGSVGNPFPFVDVCIARANTYAENGYDILARGNSRSTTVTPGCDNEPGELYIKGSNMFQQYWNKPDATKESFTADGWFKTGDTAVYENGTYRILGRTSVDIIKSGGYKISALDVERHLLAHPDIAEVAVVGVHDITWGQKVAAVMVLRPGASSLELQDLRAWSAERLPPYQLPSLLRIVETMPRNAMGKINKKSLVTQLFGNGIGFRNSDT